MASYMSIVQSDMHAGMRAILVDWLVEVSLVSHRSPRSPSAVTCNRASLQVSKPWPRICTLVYVYFLRLQGAANPSWCAWRPLELGSIQRAFSMSFVLMHETVARRSSSWCLTRSSWACPA